ncbi:thymidylate synthase [Pseudanabaena phage Pam3]|nr:thymidylate synthase [Pseudanabaena phage Pam3]
MITIDARNVNYALHAGAELIRQLGVQSPSRNGPVLVAPEPVTTVYQKPDERVMLHPERDANPFFHLYEALWMLAGRNDLAPLKEYVARMADFSDDGGKTQPGAYGYRWRRHFKMDQIAWAVSRLQADPNDRRVVIQMWDANTDIPAADAGGKDVPCNLMLLPAVREGRLDITVFCRSNDMIWGAYGANAVHFSFLQEYMARCLGLPVGRYFQIANNFHAYLATLDKAQTAWPFGTGGDPYTRGNARPFPICDGRLNKAEFKEDLGMFMEDPARVGIRSPFLKRVALPMVMSHRCWKREKNLGAALEILNQMPEWCDWKQAGELWLLARDRKLQAITDGGSQHATG